MPRLDLDTWMHILITENKLPVLRGKIEKKKNMYLGNLHLYLERLKSVESLQSIQKLDPCYGRRLFRFIKLIRKKI